MQHLTFCTTTKQNSVNFSCAISNALKIVPLGKTAELNTSTAYSPHFWSRSGDKSAQVFNLTNSTSYTASVNTYEKGWCHHLSQMLHHVIFAGKTRGAVSSALRAATRSQALLTCHEPWRDKQGPDERWDRTTLLIKQCGFLTSSSQVTLFAKYSLKHFTNCIAISTVTSW